MRQAKIFLVVIVLASVITPIGWAQEWIQWIEHPDNPVLDPDSRAYYPCVVYDMNMFDGAPPLIAGAKIFANSSNLSSIWGRTSGT